MLLVYIVCPKCQKAANVHMHGGWDIKSVTHICGQTIEITYSPVRGIF